MTFSENGPDLFQANLDSLFYGKFRGLWTREYFFDKHETSLCIKCEKRLWIPNDDMVVMSEIKENWLNTVVFGHIKHYKRSNVAPTESHKMSEHSIFLLQPFEQKQICKRT